MMRPIFIIMILLFALAGCNSGIRPVNPDASSDAKELLNFIYSLKGENILSGQHNYPGTISESTEEVYEITGEIPVVWGQDFGFTEDDKDGIIYRERNMQEAIKKHREGYIITLM